MNPTTSWTLAFGLALSACSSSDGTGASTDGAADGPRESPTDAPGDSAGDAPSEVAMEAGGGEAGGDTAGACPTVHNDPGCPDRFQHAACFGDCSLPGVGCMYPGEGDLPCPSAAVMVCSAVDGGTPTWKCFQ
ncbi:MAG: hypothetical protein NVSMB47_00380 [Polyangiales bacterium]